MRYVDLQLGAMNSGLPKGNRETDACIEQQVIVSEVCHPSFEICRVDAGDAEQSLRHPSLVEVAARWSNRQADHFVIQHVDGGRTGEQQVFDGWRLKRT